MKKPFQYTVILTFALLLAGCGSRVFTRSVQDENALVFGYLDLSDAPGKLNSVVIKLVKPASDKPYYGFNIDDGIFFRTELPTGSYKFTSFGSFKSFGNTQYTFNLPPQGRGEMDPVVNKGGIHYVGSYKYKKVKTGFFEQGKFDLERVSKPTEKELLIQLLKKAKHPDWQAAIQKRLDQLK